MNNQMLQDHAERLFEKMVASDNRRVKNYLAVLEGLASRTENNMDAIVAVCGRRGMGKSSYAILSGIMLRNFGIDFNFDDIYFGEDSLESAVGKITSAKRRAYVFDEMIDLAYSRNAMTLLNRRITQFFTKVRKMNNIVFLCLPRFRTLDTGIRNDIVHLWIEVFWNSHAQTHSERFARASIFRKDKNPLTMDPWGLDDPVFLKKRAYDVKSQYSIMKRVRSYAGELQFPALPKVLEDAYIESSEGYLKSVGEDFMESLRPKQRAKKPKPEEAGANHI